jgi:hypothetical protein
VLIDIAGVVLVVSGERQTSYRFPCPSCHQDVEAEAPPSTAELLQAAGAVVAVGAEEAPTTPVATSPEESSTDGR